MITPLDIRFVFKLILELLQYHLKNPELKSITDHFCSVQIFLETIFPSAGLVHLHKISKILKHTKEIFLSFLSERIPLASLTHPINS